jgi:hypothetical protein
MVQFYDGKRCVVLKTTDIVEWCHMMDAALEPSNARVSPYVYPAQWY